jgi:hypothetical protein
LKSPGSFGSDAAENAAFGEIVVSFAGMNELRL